MAHQSILITGRKASVFSPLHACAHGAVAMSCISRWHLTLLFWSRHCETLFLLRDQTNTNLVRVSTHRFEGAGCCRVRPVAGLCWQKETPPKAGSNPSSSLVQVVDLKPADWQRLSRRKREIFFAKRLRILHFFSGVQSTEKRRAEWIH